VNLTPGKPEASGHRVWEVAGVAMNVNLAPGKPEASRVSHRGLWKQSFWGMAESPQKSETFPDNLMFLGGCLIDRRRCRGETR
jgi:hypothetical protein